MLKPSRAAHITQDRRYRDMAGAKTHSGRGRNWVDHFRASVLLICPVGKHVRWHDSAAPDRRPRTPTFCSVKNTPSLRRSRLIMIIHFGKIALRLKRNVAGRCMNTLSTVPTATNRWPPQRPRVLVPSLERDRHKTIPTVPNLLSPDLRKTCIILMIILQSFEAIRRQSPAPLSLIINDIHGGAIFVYAVSSGLSRSSNLSSPSTFRPFDYLQ